PGGSGQGGRRYVIKGGSVMTMDGGEYAQADVVVEGKKIVAVGPGAGAGVGGPVIDATERIVMPGFIDTHHHQFETALRSFLADGVLILDGNTAPGPNGCLGKAPTPTINPFSSASRRSTGRRMSISTSCSAGSPNSTMASPR